MDPPPLQASSSPPLPLLLCETPHSPAPLAGPAYALSSRVPETIDGEVGEKRTMVLNVADKAGNRILMGSDCKAVVTCTAPVRVLEIPTRGKRSRTIT